MTPLGGYTNNHLVQFDKVDLDRFPKVHGAIKREMQQILQVRQHNTQTRAAGVRHAPRVARHACACVCLRFVVMDGCGCLWLWMVVVVYVSV